jgi:uncharacterized protein YjiS (DUF1127 family)
MTEQDFQPRRAEHRKERRRGRFTSQTIETFALCGASLYPDPLWWPNDVEPSNGREPGFARSASEAVRGVALRFAESMRATYARMQRERRARHGQRMLEELDDTVLLDLGIRRDQIWEAARFGRRPWI